MKPLKARKTFVPVVPADRFTSLIDYYSARLRIAKAVEFFRQGEWLASSVGEAIKQRISK